MERRKILKAGLALLAAPLAFLRRTEATTILAPVDVPDRDDDRIEDTVDPHDRLGDTVTERTVKPVYDEREFYTRPGRLHSGHPDCQHCHGKGTVLNGISEDRFLEFKYCPACQWELKRMGAVGWRVTSPTWGYPDCEWCRGTGDVLDAAWEISGGVLPVTKWCPMCEWRGDQDRMPPEVGPDGGFVIPEHVVADMKRAGFPV